MIRQVLIPLLIFVGLTEWPDAMYEVRSTTTLKTNRSQHKCILDHLLSKQVVNRKQCNEIKNLPSPVEKNRKLMEILLNGGEDKYHTFLEALDTFKYGNLVELIQKTQVTPTDKKIYSNLSNVERTRQLKIQIIRVNGLQSINSPSKGKDKQKQT